MGQLHGRHTRELVDTSNKNQQHKHPQQHRATRLWRQHYTVTAQPMVSAQHQLYHVPLTLWDSWETPGDQKIWSLGRVPEGEWCRAGRSQAPPMTSDLWDTILSTFTLASHIQTVIHRSLKTKQKLKIITPEAVPSVRVCARVCVCVCLLVTGYLFQSAAQDNLRITKFCHKQMHILRDKQYEKCL